MNKFEDCMRFVKTKVDGAVSYINIKGNYFDPEETITYSFMAGTNSQKQHVRDAVQKIRDVTPGLKLEEVNSGGVIRITFDPLNGAYSYLGVQNKLIPSNVATMNIGFTGPNHEVVIHEFLHALNFHHEHLRGLNFDKEAVYEYFARMGWSKDDVDNNLFDFNEEEMDFSDIDTDSIMLYSLPCSLTTDGHNCGKRNVELSEGDIARLNELFPPPPESEEVEPEVVEPEEIGTTLDALKVVFKTKEDLARMLESNLVELAQHLGINATKDDYKKDTIDKIHERMENPDAN